MSPPDLKRKRNKLEKLRQQNKTEKKKAEKQSITGKKITNLNLFLRGKYKKIKNQSQNMV